MEDFPGWKERSEEQALCTWPSSPSSLSEVNPGEMCGSQRWGLSLSPFPRVLEKLDESLQGETLWVLSATSREKQLLPGILCLLGSFLEMVLEVGHLL